MARQVGQYWSWIGDVQRLSQQQDELAEERNKLLAELARLQATERENQALREQLSLGKKSRPILNFGKISWNY